MPPNPAPADDGPPLRLAQAPIIVVTRFSFVGQSGWKGDASRNADLLFDKDRLRSRLTMFATITLPSLARQTDTGFVNVILTSDKLPPWAMTELRDACDRAYGDAARYEILARPPSPARRPLRTYMQTHLPGPAVVQVVLDDDDGLALDFIALMREDLAGLEPANLPLPYFLSYPFGYGLVLDENWETALYRHRYPFINAGLTMIGTPGGKNILGIDHQSAPRKYGARLLRQRAMFLRSVHGFNDSRVTPTERWQAMPDWRSDTDLAERFSYVLDGAQGDDGET